MCGLAGCAGTLYAADEQAFRKLLIYNSVRGTDSTGAGSIKRHHQKDGAIVAKELGNPFELFCIKRKNEFDFNDVISGQNKVLIGHTRSATKGSVFRRNAHPFLFDNILGAHNGTLEHFSINKLTYHRKYDTDSEALLCEIEMKSVQEVIPKMEGAWALAWYDMRDNTINLLRNDKRTLYYTFDEDDLKLYWSSEWEHLASATNQIKRKANSIHLLPENTLFSWALPDLNQKFSDPKRESLEGAKPFPLVDKTGGDGNNYKYSGYYNKKRSGIPEWSSILKRWSKWDFVLDCEVYSHDMTGPWATAPEYAKTISKTINTDKSSDVVGIDKMKEEYLDKTFKDEIGDVPDTRLVFKSASLRAYYHDKDAVYFVFEHKGFKLGWEKRQACKIAPSDIPYTTFNIDSNHSFHHQGHGVRKKISYKGFKGKLLPEGDFNELMVSGCLCCSRRPEWGNLVVFINQTDFLCEHCSRDEQEVHGWRMIDKA